MPLPYGGRPLVTRTRTRARTQILGFVKAASIDVTGLTCILTPGTGRIVATTRTITPIVSGGRDGTVAVPSLVTVPPRRGGGARSGAARPARQAGAHHTGTVAIRAAPVLSTRNSRNAHRSQRET